MRRTRSDYERPRALHMPRSRGAVTGLVLLLLGAWGALIPFVGPIFNWSYALDPAWTWTAAKGWLEVLPGVAAAVGGLLLLTAGNRASAVLGGWLAVFAGAWFVVGRTFSATLNIGDVGQPLASTDLRRALLEVTYFTGLGALIVFLGGAALARVAVRHARDLRDVPVAEPVTTAGAAPAPYDETVPVAPAGSVAAAETEPREGTGGFFRRHSFRRHHAGV